MRAKEIRDLGAADLRHKEQELREELARLRLRRGVGQGENPMKMRHTRRHLARVLTVLRAAEKKG